MKKTFSLLLALCLALTLLVPAAAADAPEVTVQWMGETVAFPDAQPHIRSGRTMAPVRALAEAAGAAVDYDAGLVTLRAADGTLIRFRPGELTAERVSGGVTDRFSMDAAPYIEDGRTYVPLRFFAEALGCDVGWDNALRCAVAADRDALIAELDAPFGRVNAALAALRESAAALGESKRLQGSAALTLTALDSLNGDRTVSAALDYSVLTNGAAAEGVFALNAAELLALLPDAETYDAAEREALELLRAGLEKTEIRVICDSAAGSVYVRVPDWVGALPGTEIPTECWLKLTAEDLPFGGGTAPDLRAESVGAMLYDAAAAGGLAADTVNGLRAAAAELAAVLGDGAFTDGTVALDRSSPVLAGLLGEEALAGLDALNLRITVQESGNFALSFALCSAETNAALTLSAAPGRSELNLQLHVKNTLRLALTFRGTAQRYGGTVAAAPPADAAVFSPDELGTPLGSAGDMLTEIPGALAPLTGK